MYVFAKAIQSLVHAKCKIISPSIDSIKLNTTQAYVIPYEQCICECFFSYFYIGIKHISLSTFDLKEKHTHLT